MRDHVAQRCTILVEDRRAPKIHNTCGLVATLENKHVQNQAEITEIFNNASQRDAVIISLTVKSELRLEVLGNDNGTYGLKMKDLSDIAIQGGVAICTKRSMKIIVRAELSKTRLEELLNAMRKSFTHAEKYLNIETIKEDKTRKIIDLTYA